MKRVGGLFDAIVDLQTLTYAAWRAAKGKRTRHGRAEILGFLARIENESATISRQLRSGGFRFEDYRSFAIRDPKSRVIHAPSFRDRVVHHAIVAVARPAFERGAIAHSYACRLGRGQHAALNQLRQWMRPGDWFLKVDVSRYYDSVDHGILRLQLERRFRERRLLALLDRLLDSYASAPGKGLPIGALTSQYLGNFYLDPFDHWEQRQGGVRHYMRYMDDSLFLGARRDLDGVRREIAAMLEGFGLRMKDGGVLNACELGVPYLGFVAYPDRLRLNARARRRLRRKVKDLERGFERGRVRERELQAQGEALFAHARFADDVAWRRMVTAFSRLGELRGRLGDFGLRPDPGCSPDGGDAGARNAFSAAVRGTTPRTGAAQRTATGGTRMTATGTTGFGSVWLPIRWQKPPDDAFSCARLCRDKAAEPPRRADICLVEFPPTVEKARRGAGLRRRSRGGMR